MPDVLIKCSQAESLLLELQICFTWPKLIFGFFFSQNLPASSMCLSCVFFLDGSFRSNIGTQMALKNNGTWLSNHTRVSASPAILCSLHLDVFSSMKYCTSLQLSETFFIYCHFVWTSLIPPFKSSVKRLLRALEGLQMQVCFVPS